MKYIMFEIEAGGQKQLIPIIFPNDLIHKEVSEALQGHRRMRELNFKPVSAGQCLVRIDSVHGDSETQKLKAKAFDHKIINDHDYFHGLMDPYYEDLKKE